MGRKQWTGWLLLSCALALAATVAGAKTRSPNVDERGIVAADRAWGYAATAKDLDQTLSFYAEDAVLLAPNAPAAEGRPAIRAFWSAEFKDPAYSLSWHTDTVTVARSGELGYARGSYDATYTAEGRAVREHGKFLVIWKKVPGAWLVAADMFSPDAPPTPTNP